MYTNCTFVLANPGHKIENRKTPNFKGYSPLLSGNNNPENAGDFHEGFEFGWEEIDAEKNNTASDEGGEMAGKNVWPSGIPAFRETVLQY